MEYIILNNQIEMPILGLGVFQVPDKKDGAHLLCAGPERAHRPAAALSARRRSGRALICVFLVTKAALPAPAAAGAGRRFCHRLKSMLFFT